MVPLHFFLNKLSNYHILYHKNSIFRDKNQHKYKFNYFLNPFFILIRKGRFLYINIDIKYYIMSYLLQSKSSIPFLKDRYMSYIFNGKCNNR